ncbi:hypothetical protein [Sphingomonas sp. Leaf4]|uniref:hypothetical protein n=1 Tax=Sphingomonas sp. Leaf4 TaxID=2876553 RepID=UPI001E3AEB71|nr:hypothetical protein [Sphingomonas sp. Leaf4]
MAKDETTTVLDATGVAAVRFMLERLSDRDVTKVFQTVEGQGAIGDLASDAMQDRNIDL